jgi:radical SAM protein with 4Fe4S-binding SPASM domain
VVNFLKDAKKLGADRLNLTGGEIFTRKDAMEVIKKANALGYYVSIESNATLINDEILQSLKNLNNYFISISLDGIDSKTHDYFRGVAGSFDKTMAVIKKCSEMNIPFRATTMLNKKNISQIPEILKLVINLGGRYRLLAFIQQYRKGVEARNHYGITKKHLIDFLDNKFFPLMEEYETKEKGMVSVELPLALWPFTKKIEHGPLCPWGETLVGLSPDGTVGLCHVTGGERELTAGNIRRESLKDIWEKSDFFQKIRKFDPNKLKGVCGNCLAREVCRGGCRVHAFRYYGDLYAPNPDCQDIYNAGLFPEYALEETGSPNKYESTTKH